MSSDYSTEKIRTFALVGAHGSGKTTLAEGLLYINGTFDKLGKVTNGTSELDYESEEKHRNMSINTHACFYVYNRHLVNTLDTPGFPVFLYQTDLALDISDFSILVISGITDSKEQIDRYFNLISKRDLPFMIFINKLDTERSDFEAVLNNVRNSLNINPVVLSLPIGAEHDLKGVIDILGYNASYIDGNKAVLNDIPDEMSQLASGYRQKLIESVAELDDNLLERYLNGEELQFDEIKAGLNKGVANMKIVPVVAGSASNLIGLHYLSDLINDIMPSPLIRNNLACIDKEGQLSNIKISETEPVICTVFKTISDPYAGKISILKICSGSVTPDSTLFNARTQSKIKLGQISKIIGKKLQPVNEATVGEIVAVNKIKDLNTADTLSDSHDLRVRLTQPSQTVLSYAIEPHSRADEDKLMQSIARVAEEDPTIDFHRDEETNDFLLSGTGQVHVEVVVEKLRSTYGVNVDLKTPKVPYKETIKATAKAEGRYIKQTGGRGQYGDAWIQIEPIANGKGYEFVDKIVGGVIPKNYIPSVEKGVREAMKKGVIAGYPVVGVKVTLFDGKYHPVDSSDIAFQIAGSMAFKKAMENSKPTLLEPIMKIIISTPEDCLGDVIGDINSRRGKVSGMDTSVGSNEVNALVPMSEILTYAPELRSITSGRGGFTLDFSHYEEMPSHIAQKIVENKKTAESEEH